MRCEKVEGVVSPCFNAGKEHLLLIAYNTEKTNTAILLEKARQKAIPPSWSVCKRGGFGNCSDLLRDGRDAFADPRALGPMPDVGRDLGGHRGVLPENIEIM